MSEPSNKELMDKMEYLEALIWTLICCPKKQDCTWQNGEQPYKCAFHPQFPWKGHLCPNHKINPNNEQ